MARRADHTRDELTKLVLAAAREIVVEEGFRGLTTRKLAARIGYSAGSIYNVFHNIDALIIEIDASLLDELFEAVTSEPLPGGVEPALKALARRYVVFVQNNQNLWNLLFEHRLPPGEVLPDWYYPKLERLLAIVEERLRPLFDDSDAAAVGRSVRLLWAGVHGIASLAGTGKLKIISSDGAMELIDDLIDNYVAGVRANNRI